MAKLTKKQKQIQQKYDFCQTYTLDKGIALTKDSAKTNFDSSVDIAFRLNVNPKKAEHTVRGVAILPHGTGKVPRILVLCTLDKEQEAKEAGADHVGMDEYLKKIEQGWTDIDLVITMPTLMAKVGRLGKILGPRGLMPNPKTGTVTLEVGKAVQEAKSGKISFKIDKYGIIHTSLGRVSFSPKQLVENTQELFSTLLKLKPTTVKGTYIKSIFLSSTMGKGISIDQNSINTL